MSKSKAGGMAPLFIFAGAIILLDQLTKYLLVQAIPLNTGIPIIPGFFNLVHVLNPGGAFSIFAASGSPWRQYVFIALTVIVVIAIAFAYGKVTKNDTWTRAAYICISGGAVGNLIDRVRMGEVIDFLDFYVGSWHWPVFNVADTAISTGAVMLLLSLIRSK
ncbi:MAG: signal peptidase II [Syntrophobacteraceae bacterium]